MKKDLKTAVYICRKTHRGAAISNDRHGYPVYRKDTQLAEPCTFESGDEVEFLLHMKKVHGGGRRITIGKLPKLRPADHTPRQSKPFEPTALEVGAEVTWKQLVPTGETQWTPSAGERPVSEWVERTGQVWCLAYGGSWVIPFDEIADEAELAVLVRPSYLNDGKYEHSQTWHGSGRRAAA